jgi:general transcription factor 3C polypeptide 3 (transcription factor C subunit 4)
MYVRDFVRLTRTGAEFERIVISTDPSNNDAKMKLAEIYEITNQPRKALALVYQGEQSHCCCCLQ